MGLQFDDAKLGFLGDVLRRRLETNGGEYETYLLRLEEDRSKQELGALAQELTVGETYFFRHMDQFRAFADVALPDRLRARQSGEVSIFGRTLRILSAGCASGEEAYSLAILVRETMGENSHEVSVGGVDINPLALKKALDGRYSNWALRETPPDMHRRWFRPDGREVILNDEARGSVTFEERNLVTDDAELWRPNAFDIVFCRNVIMYFTQENAQALVARISRALAPGGYLFLGHAETLRGISQDFHLLHTHETFYYRRKERAGQAFPGAVFPDAVRPASVPTLAPIIENNSTWVETIHKAADRIQALVRSAPVLPRPNQRSTPGLRQALELVQKERFSEALDVIEALSPESAADPDALLLNAVLLTHAGRLPEAEEMCRRLLSVDDLSAGAHYVLALCRENAGDRRRSTEHDQVAIYLDPAFAMPHLHLGLLARRADDRETARCELHHALSLLQREDASRLLLFGGGFSRETLIALCRAELNACGGEL